MKLVYYPNEILDKGAQELVTVFDEALAQTLDEMKKIMLDNNGLAIAANQVGLPQRMFVMKDKKGDVHDFINPIIIDTEGSVLMDEGCLSAPDIILPVVRPAAVYIEYQDRKGEKRKAIAEGLEAREILHEMDHLNGIFFFSKVNRQVRKQVLAKLRKKK